MTYVVQYFNNQTKSSASLVEQEIQRRVMLQAELSSQQQILSQLKTSEKQLLLVCRNTYIVMFSNSGDYMYKYMNIHEYIFIINEHIHTYIHTYIHTCVYVCVRVCACVCACVCMCVCACVYKNTHIHIYINM